MMLSVDTTTPRCSWLLARIIDVYPDVKGQVRKVKLKAKSAVLERPIDKCILLEGVNEL